MSEEATKDKKGYWVKIVRAVLAALAAAAIGYGAAKFGLLETEADKQHVENIKTAVTKSIQGEELTEKEATDATTGAIVVTGKVVQKTQEAKKAESAKDSKAADAKKAAEPAKDAKADAKAAPAEAKK